MDYHFFFFKSKVFGCHELMKYIQIEQSLKEVALGFIFVSNIYDMPKVVFHEDRS